MFFSLQIGGLAVLGIGIWTSEGEYGSRQLSTLIGVELYRVDSFLLMVGGGVIISLTLIGLCGVLIPYKCLLGLVSMRYGLCFVTILPTSKPVYRLSSQL